MLCTNASKIVQWGIFFTVEDECFMKIHLSFHARVLLPFLDLIVHLGLVYEKLNEFIEVYLAGNSGCLPCLIIHVEYLIKVGNATTAWLRN